MTGYDIVSFLYLPWELLSIMKQVSFNLPQFIVALSQYVKLKNSIITSRFHH